MLSNLFKKKKAKMNRREVLVSPDTHAYQNYADIQINLDFASVDQKKKFFAVTSTAPGEGKSSTCVNLAQVYANSDNKVLIIDLDLRRPTIHYFFKIPNSNGITDYCFEKCDLETAIHHTKINNLDIITAGTHTPYPNKVLQSQKLNSLFEIVKNKYDYIFVDTPPVLAASDMVSVSGTIDQYIVVCYSGVTKKNEFNETISRLRNADVDIAGVVLTHVKKHDKKAYGYNYYSYGYGKSK